MRNTAMLAEMAKISACIVPHRDPEPAERVTIADAVFIPKTFETAPRISFDVLVDGNKVHSTFEWTDDARNLQIEGLNLDTDIELVAFVMARLGGPDHDFDVREHVQSLLENEVDEIRHTSGYEWTDEFDVLPLAEEDLSERIRYAVAHSHSLISSPAVRRSEISLYRLNLLEPDDTSWDDSQVAVLSDVGKILIQKSRDVDPLWIDTFSIAEAILHCAGRDPAC